MVKKFLYTPWGTTWILSANQQALKMEHYKYFYCLAEEKIQSVASPTFDSVLILSDFIFFIFFYFIIIYSPFT